jgi:hypothetical protein
MIISPKTHRKKKLLCDSKQETFRFIITKSFYRLRQGRRILDKIRIEADSSTATAKLEEENLSAN